MSERKWCPADWLDEAPPKLGTRPEDFIERQESGLILRPLRDAGIDHDEDWPPVTPITSGTVVPFMWNEDRGSRIATIQADGSFTLDAPFDEDANCFCDDFGVCEVEYEPKSVVEAFTDPTEGPFPRDVQINGWTWSEPEPFRLTVLESGDWRFDPVDPHRFEPMAENEHSCVACHCHPNIKVHQVA